ncbi:hypothetical protein Ndes2526B_g00806 [Nannochloris sp. 'desiccata']
MSDSGAVPVVDTGLQDGMIEQRRGRTRHRWGPIPSDGKPAPSAATAGISGGDGAAPALKKRRRSRWDTAGDTTNTDAANTTAGSGVVNAANANATPANDDSRALMLFPGEIVLSNGIKINLPPALTGRHSSGDPEVVKLHKELVELDRKVRMNIVDLIPPESERSPSPSPIYDSNGIRQNTREVRMKEKIARQRNIIIEELLKRDPTYQPPADYKPEKKSRKLYIPYKEYPDYNFIGLIIGPRGNTHKRMQQETNTVIAIRGKGSVKEGARGDYGDDDDLHVLVQGDTQDDVDRAAVMVERLLQPMDEEMNQHKQKQLRELALINGTLKEENYCFLCGDASHRQIECPKKDMEVYRLPDAVQVQVEEQYARDLARLNPGEANKADEEYKSFLAELGGTDPRSSTAAAVLQGGVGGAPIDNLKLWVGNLPQSMDSNSLRTLFEPFGQVTFAEVRLDNDSGLSRGFGFVHYMEESQARDAIDNINGTQIEGKSLIVRRKGEDARSGGVRAGLGSGGERGPPPPRPEDDLPPECKIYVGSIPPHVDDFTLKREFERFGPIVSIRQIFDRETRQPKGFGFVAYADGGSAANAIAAMDGYPGFDPMLRPIVVRQAGDGGRDGPRGGGGGGGRYPPRGGGGGRGGRVGGYGHHGSGHYQQQQQHHYSQQQHYPGGGAPHGGEYGAYPPPPPPSYYGGEGGYGGAPGAPVAGGGYDASGYDPYGSGATDPYAAYYGYGGGAAAGGESYGAVPGAPIASAGGEYGAVPPPPSVDVGVVGAGMMPPLPPPPPPPEEADGNLGLLLPPPPPPPPSGGGEEAAPPPPAAPAANEYERFMAEMQNQLP